MTKTISTISQFHNDGPLIGENENNDLLPLKFEDFAAMSLETVYVLDFLKRGFRFVSDRNTFLDGHSVKDVLSFGYDFFQKVIHHDDLPLLKNMHMVMLQRLHDKNDLGNINYFSFVVRIKNESRYIMVHHKLKPVFVDGKIRYGIYFLTSSILKTSGHLCVHYNNSIDCDEYSFSSKRWGKGIIYFLSIREKNVLKLAKQGKTSNEIARELFLSPNTIRNVKTTIFQKLNVKNMIQAVTYAANQHLIYNYDSGQTPVEPLQDKRTRHLITPDMILRIQERLNIGCSVNSIAKQENISESSIRYAINIGRLRRKRVI